MMHDEGRDILYFIDNTSTLDSFMGKDFITFNKGKASYLYKGRHGFAMQSTYIQSI